MRIQRLLNRAHDPFGMHILLTPLRQPGTQLPILSLEHFLAANAVRHIANLKPFALHPVTQPAAPNVRTQRRLRDPQMLRRSIHATAKLGDQGY